MQSPGAAYDQHNLTSSTDGDGRLICSGTHLGAGQVQRTSGLVHPPLFIPHEASGWAPSMGSRWT